MAVDPLTAKILAKVAMQAATDSESRKRILFMILAPVLGLLLLIAFILYLITSPFSVLSQWLIGDEVNVVEDFQKQYGYNQQLGIYEKDYIDGSGQSYEGVIFTDGATEVVYYNQLDERWADLPYGTDNIGGYGCGPTSMAIVVSSLTDQTVDPPTMAEWAYQNGYWCSGNGSYHSLIPGAAEGFGLQWESISTDDPQAVVDALASGKLIVALMSKGHFTSSGHFMVLRGVTSEGKILVADPASKKRSEQKGCRSRRSLVGDLLKGCDMNNRNKLIELFIYIVIVVVGIVLLLTGGADDKTSAENMRGESYAVVLDE